MIAIPEVAGIENSRVNHLCSTGQIVCRGGSACARENSSRGLGYAVYDLDAIIGRSAGRIGIQDLGPKGIWMIRLGPGRELWVSKRQNLVPRGCRRAQRFQAEEEEELVMGNDGTADCPRQVVAMKRIVRLSGTGQRILGIHLLVVEIVAG